MQRHRITIKGDRVFVWVGKHATNEDVADSFRMLLLFCYSHKKIDVFADMRQAKEPDAIQRKEMRNLLAFNDDVLNSSIRRWAILLPSKLHLRFMTAISWGIQRPKYGQRIFFKEADALAYLDETSEEKRI